MPGGTRDAHATMPPTMAHVVSRAWRAAASASLEK
jgi:hypothetical protein